MRLPRIAALVLALSLAPIGMVWAQTDPLQDANQLFRQGQFDRAMDRVNTYLSSRPKDARGRFLKGLILTEQNKPNEAIKVFTDLSQDYPELPEPYNNLAVLYASQGQYDKALQLDRSNQAAQGKLNLIKELFSQTPRTQTASATATTGKGSQVAVA